MITLENDKLRFSFPAITAELWALAKEKAGKLTTQMLATNRAAEFERLQRNNYEFDSLTDSYKAKATEALLSLTPEAIQEAIEKFVGRAAPFDPNAKTAQATTISFQRTLRIPDDGKTYPLPPGLGNFPLVHVDDHAKSVPEVWNKRGGIMMPMYQAEALWLHFNGSYPCALKVGAGKINAVSGLPWTSSLQKEPQDYLPLPNQPWLDGYCVKKGTIRQFIAMPLGKGYSAEEQISGKGEFGGIQLQLYPLKAAIFFDERIKPRFPKRLADILPSLLPRPEQEARRIAPKKLRNGGINKRAIQNQPVTNPSLLSMKFASEYSTRRQINIMLLTTLADLRCARKQEAIGYISSHRYFDVQTEDLEPYPKSLTREPRWHTLIAWARKDCLVAGFLMDGERDSWAITRDGVRECADAQEKFRSGVLDPRRCYMWTPTFKQFMQPGYVPSSADRKRPLDVYRDVHDATVSRLLAEYALI